MAKRRLDILIVENGLVASRQEAQTAIMDGAIIVDGQKITKPGTPVAPEAKIELLSWFEKPKYVSRGGLKLERALKVFQIDLTEQICLDVGASTGGFTDCMLKHGARRVYAIDVGYGQLDWTLRQDKRVVIHERMNARYLNPDLVYKGSPERADFAAIDVSFISLSKILPAIKLVLKPVGFSMVCLIKPQFEAGRNQVGKGGVVHLKETHISVIRSILQELETLDLEFKGLTHSPVRGPAGNIEYLLYAGIALGSPAHIDVEAWVNDAHRMLN